jgi:hypothetical protein
MLTRRSVVASLFAIPLLPAKLDRLLPWHTRLINAAREQIGVTVDYDPSYVVLSYPGGDIERAKGVCTDVVIRAYRDAFGADLQQLVHEDMRGAFASYPNTWGLKRPDKNIDHRRVPNLETFFKRRGMELAVPSQKAEWQPGDLITMRLGGRLPHIGIISDRLAPGGYPLTIHNIGGGTREDDLIGVYSHERRFRFQPD